MEAEGDAEAIEIRLFEAIHLRYGYDLRGYAQRPSVAASLRRSPPPVRRTYASFFTGCFTIASSPPTSSSDSRFG